MGGTSPRKSGAAPISALGARLAAWIIQALTVLAFMAVATAAPGKTAPARPPGLTEAAQAAVSGWVARMEALRSKQARDGRSATVSAELSRRAALDQAARDGVSAISDGSLSQVEKDAAIAQVWPLVMQQDDNSAFLKRRLPPAGWFSVRTAGADTSHNAWPILRHSPDRALQKAALRRMRPLLATGDVSGPDYARLFDRVSIFGGKRQRYGAQATCQSGRKVFELIEDEEHVDQRRHQIGLTEALADYAVTLDIGTPC